MTWLEWNVSFTGLYVETSGIGIWKGNRDFGTWDPAGGWRSLGDSSGDYSLVLLPSHPLILDPPMPQYLPPCAMLSYLPLGTLWNWAQTSLSFLELRLVGAFPRAMWRVTNKICDICVPLYLLSRSSPPHYWKAKALLFSLSAFQVEVVLSWEDLSNTPNSHFKFLLFTCKESITYLLSLKHCVYTLAAINALLFQVSSRFHVPRVRPFYCLL